MRISGYILFLFILIVQQPLYSQNRGCSTPSIVFKSGEKVTYRAVYNWGFIWINAGDVVFSVSDTIYKGIPSYHLKSQGWSLKQYDWFYKVRDRFESIINKDSITPYWFERDTYEGDYKAYNRYDFDYINKKITIDSYTSDRSYKQNVYDLKPCTFDVLSAIYYCRCIDFNSLDVGQKYPLTMGIDNEVFNLFIRYLGKEHFTAHDGKQYNTIKFSVMLVKGTIFRGGEDLYVWVTDDKNHIPVQVEAKILVGSVKALLTSVEGL